MVTRTSIEKIMDPYLKEGNGYRYLPKEKIDKVTDVIVKRSRLLDFYEELLFDFDDDEIKMNKRRHYGIYTENHILDVISNSKPRIQKIDLGG